MKIKIYADNPTTTKDEVVKYLIHRSNTIRSQVYTQEYKKEQEKTLAEADAIFKMAMEIKNIGIVNLSEPQDWESLAQMEDAARSRAGKAVHMKSPDPWHQLSVIQHSDDKEPWYDNGTINIPFRDDALKHFEDIKRKAALKDKT